VLTKAGFKMKIVLAFLLFLVFLPGIAGATDQNSINEQLKQGGTIHLQAGTITLSDSLIVPSNTVLEGTLGPNGEKLTVIQVQAHAGWPSFKPLILVSNAQKVVIKDLIIDGNRNNNLDVGAVFPGGKAWGHGFYNCIHFIDCDNGEVYNVELRNGLGDGVRTKYCTNLKFHDNVCYNLGHDAFYGVDSQNIEAYNNKIETETDDGLRLWNSEHVRFYNNYITAGENPDGLSGNAGFQVEFSKLIENADIEICNNIIYKSWGSAFWLIGYGQGSGKNHGINIHHNLVYFSPFTHSIDYAAGITVYGANGIDIRNNVFDGAKNSAVSSQIGGENTVIQDNIITNTRELEINQAGNGYGIADRSGAGLSIVNNCFYNNQNGNLYSCSSSGDDLQDPKSHATSSGWTWTGSTWTCAFVPPMPLGEVAPTKTRNSTDTDTHEIDDIWDILNLSYVDSGNSTSENVNPEIHEETKGKSRAWVDIVGWNNMIERDGILYIPEGEQPIVKYGADNTAGKPISTDTNLKLTENNSTVTADLKVKAVYGVAKRSTVTVNGLSLPSLELETKSQTSHYYDSEPVPETYRPAINNTAYVTILNNSMSSQTRVFIPESSDVMKVLFEYNNTETWHHLHTGIENTTEKGVKYVQVTDLDYWEGENVSRLGSTLVIPGNTDPYQFESKVKIVQYDVYGKEIPVTDYQIEVINQDEKKLINPGTLLFSGVVGIFAIGIFKILGGIL
jgi:hypothetical protein